MATVSDGCSAAASRVSCGTSSSQLVAMRPEILTWGSAEARHSAQRAHKHAGSGWPCSGSTRASLERLRSSRATTVKLMADVSAGCRAAAARMSCGTTASQLVAKRPESLPWCSAEARQSAQRLRKRAGSGWPCSSRASRMFRLCSCFYRMKQSKIHIVH